MQLLLANAKMMHERAKRTPQTMPQFQSIALRLAEDMVRMDVAELAEQLDCSSSLASKALKNYKKMLECHTQGITLAQYLPALLAYNGQAYKHLRADTLDEASLDFAQQHLWITCFLYGLLRPLDGILPYRMEHCVRLQVTDDVPMNQWWRTQGLTDLLIDRVKADDGILLHLSTGEYEALFDWKRVCREVRVVQPLFYVRKGNVLKTQAVWAKACRGAITRYVLQHRITDPSDLQEFAYEGFQFQPDLGEADYPHFVRED